MFVQHLETVDQLVDLQRNRHRHPRLRQYRGKVGVLKRQLTLNGIVMFVESSAGDNDAQ